MNEMKNGMCRKETMCHRIRFQAASDIAKWTYFQKIKKNIVLNPSWNWYTSVWLLGGGSTTRICGRSTTRNHKSRWRMKVLFYENHSTNDSYVIRYEAFGFLSEKCFKLIYTIIDDSWLVCLLFAARICGESTTWDPTALQALLKSPLSLLFQLTKSVFVAAKESFIWR